MNPDNLNSLTVTADFSSPGEEDDKLGSSCDSAPEEEEEQETSRKLKTDLPPGFLDPLPDSAQHSPDVVVRDCCNQLLKDNNPPSSSKTALVVSIGCFVYTANLTV